MAFVIPIDGRPHSQRAIDLALSVFDVNGHDVRLVHAIEEASGKLLLSDRTGSLESRLSEASLDCSDTLLARLAEPLVDAGGRVGIHIAPGSPQSVIKGLMTTLPGPVVIAAPERHSPQELLFGASVTAGLADFDCDFTLVAARKQAGADGEIVVAATGCSEDELAISRLIGTLSRKRTVVLTYQPAAGASFDPHGDQPGAPPASRLTEAKEAALLESLAALFRQQEFSVRVRRTEGPFSSFWQDYSARTPVDLMALTRTRADVLHRPIGGAESERLFASLVCSSALSCTRIHSLTPGAGL